MKKLWSNIKKWGEDTAAPWLLKSWLQLVNVIVVMLAYAKLDNAGINGAGIIGFWAIILLAYWIFWKFFGVDKLIMPLLEKLWDKVFHKK